MVKKNLKPGWYPYAHHPGRNLIIHGGCVPTGPSPDGPYRSGGISACCCAACRGGSFQSNRPLIALDGQRALDGADPVDTPQPQGSRLINEHGQPPDGLADRGDPV